MRQWPGIAISIVALSACAPDEKTDEMPGAFEGSALFETYCAACHGATGTGNGVLAERLSPGPADLTVLSRDNAGVFPTVAVLSTIDGYTRMETPGQNMPEFGLLLHGESVPIDTGDGTLTPTPRPLAALLAYLESIQT